MVKYRVSLVSLGTLYRAEVEESYDGGCEYHHLTCGDWGDKESAIRSYKRYVKKYGGEC